MKNILSVVILLTTMTCNADNGCMSMKAKDLGKYDNKCLNNVSCLCNCALHNRFDARGTCERCRHFHAEEGIIIVKTPKTERAQTAHKAEIVHSRAPAISLEFDVQVISSAVKKTRLKRSQEAAKAALFRPMTLTTNKVE